MKFLHDILIDLQEDCAVFYAKMGNSKLLSVYLAVVVFSQTFSRFCF